MHLNSTQTRQRSNGTMDQAITEMLKDWRDGKEAAPNALWSLLHGELRQLARRHISGQQAGHTLQATALVNEAFLKLVNVEFRGESRKEFFALASKAMRNILIDHARKKSRDKRGGDALQVTLAEIVANEVSADEIIEIDELLTRLSTIDERMGHIVELKVFGGLTYDEIAALLGLSSSTVRADMRFGIAWLKREMQ